jgi:ribosome-associated heat shock protein Hsp15
MAMDRLMVSQFAAMMGLTMEESPLETVRLDRWLLAARCFKTRALAQKACVGGHVSVNDCPAGPDRAVRGGDTVDVLTPGGRRVLRVTGLGVRRGSTEAARALFEDVTPPAPPSDLPRVLRDLAFRDPGAGRPTKRDARAIRRLKWLP